MDYVRVRVSNLLIVELTVCSQDVRMKNLKREMAKNKLLMQHSLQPGQLTLNNGN